MKNTIIHLIGFPGTGKYTIAKEIIRLKNFCLVDNHLINNPIFNVIANDGITPLPEKVWDYTTLVRKAVLDTMVKISPPDYNFVLTNNLYEEDLTDQKIYDDIYSMAIARNATFIPIRLLISKEQNVKRITQGNRKKQLKDISPETPHYNANNHTVLNPNHPNMLELDVSDLSASQAAKQILIHTRAISNHK